MSDADLRALERSGDEQRLMQERLRRGRCPGCGGPSVEWPGSDYQACEACVRPGAITPSAVEIPSFWRSASGGVVVTWVPLENLQATRRLFARPATPRPATR